MSAGVEPPTGPTALVAGLAIPAVVVDADGLLTAWNEAACPRVRPPDGNAGGQPAAGVVADLDLAVRVPLSGAAGGFLLVWPDRAEAATIALQKADTLGRLAGGIYHDLANQLGAIWTFSGILATEPGIPEDLKESAGLQRDEADRARRLVRAALEFARRDAPSRTRVALGPLVRECLELVAYPTMPLDKRVDVSEVMPELEADPTVLRQIVLALLVSAVESLGGTWSRGEPTGSGQLRIAGYLAEEDARYRQRLTFEDSGPGVPAADLARLFRGGGGRATRDLAVAAALAERCGGVLDYEPQVEGNRFVLDLPLAGEGPLPKRSVSTPRVIPQAERPTGEPADPDPAWSPAWASEPAATRTQESAASPEPAHASPDQLTVLVCDDEPSIRGLLARVIARGGHKAREASGGAEALSIIDAEPVDLVMADQRMADMTGVDLYRAAVERRPELRTRFVLMSGDAGTPELVEFAAATGLQVIEKPFDLSVVSATLRRLAAG